MEQKYIKDSYNLDGNVHLNKKLIGNYIDLIRISPLSARVFMLLCAYASRNNTVITDVRSISSLLGSVEEKDIKGALNTLRNNSYIEINTVKIDKSIDINGVTHDRKLYKESNNSKWEVTGKKLVTSYNVTGEFNLITISDQFAVADENENDGSNLILHIKGRLFVDTSILDEDINTFIYPEVYK